MVKEAPLRDRSSKGATANSVLNASLMSWWPFESGKLDKCIFLIHLRGTSGLIHCLTWYVQIKVFSHYPTHISRRHTTLIQSWRQSRISCPSLVRACRIREARQLLLETKRHDMTQDNHYLFLVYFICILSMESTMKCHTMVLE